MRETRSPIRHLVPEAQLLFHLLAGPTRDGAALALLEAGLDWEYFSWLVGKEKAVTVVHARLRDFPAGLVPPQVTAALSRQALVTQFRMARLEQRLTETLAALRGAGIEVMLLKGAGLATTVYGSIAERPMADLDLMVRPRDGAKAWEVVRRTGWRPESPVTIEGLYDEHQHYPPLLDEGGTTLGLDLHTSLLSAGHPFDLPLDEVWRRAVPVPSRGDGVYVLDGATQVLHICLHFAWSHVMRASAWRTCRDLGTLLASGRVDWGEVVELAETARAATCVYWTLRLARDLAGLAVPDTALDRLAPPGSPLLLRCLERHYLSQLVKGRGLGCPSPRLAELGWTLGIRPGWSGHGQSRPWSRVSLFQEARLRAEGDTEQTTSPAASPWLRTISRLRDHLAKIPALVRYLGYVSGLAVPQPKRAAASRRAISSSPGLRASASRERTLPAR